MFFKGSQRTKIATAQLDTEICIPTIPFTIFGSNFVMFRFGESTVILNIMNNHSSADSVSTALLERFIKIVKMYLYHHICMTCHDLCSVFICERCVMASL